MLFAEKNIKAQLDEDPAYDDGTQWHLHNDGRDDGVVGADIHAPGAWDIFTGSTGITIAIIDTGVDTLHSELVGKATGDLPEGNGHGTHVAGLAAARANNNQGGRGVDWNAHILSERIFDAGGYIGDAGAANKITTAVNNGVQVLNNSWGGPDYSSTVGMAFAYAYKMNRTSVAAMGNTGQEEVRYPAAYNNVIAVGATTNRDQHSPFSTTGDHIRVAAPGGLNADSTDPRNIYSTWLNNGYRYDAGTSMATAQVSGLASLIKGYRISLANDDIMNIIELSADDVNAGTLPGWDNQLGFGRINAERALTDLRDNSVYHWSTTGGTVAGHTTPYTMVILGANGLADGTYTVYRYDVRANVTFPLAMCRIIGGWGRGIGTTGWNLSSPNYGEGFCEVLPGTLTATSATLRTYVYDVYNTIGQHLGFYPTSPQNVTFQYSVLGIPQHPPLQFSYETNSCSSGTITAQILNATSYSWHVYGDLLIDGISTTKTTTVNYINVTGTNGNVTVTASVPCVGSVTGYGAYQPFVRTIQYAPPGPPLFPGDQLSVSIDPVEFANNYKWYLNDQLVAQGEPQYCTCDYPENPVQCGMNTIRVDVVTDCGTFTSAEDEFEMECYYAAKNFSISPNPAQKMITITVSNPQNTKFKSLSSSKTGSKNITGIKTVKIYDASGKLMKQQLFSNNLSQVQINISGLSAGVYFVKVSDGKEEGTQRLVIGK